MTSLRVKSLIEYWADGLADCLGAVLDFAATPEYKLDAPASGVLVPRVSAREACLVGLALGVPTCLRCELVFFSASS